MAPGSAIPEGDEGWVHKNALSGKRTAIVTGAQRDLRGEPNTNAAVAAHLEAGAIWFSYFVQCRMVQA